MGLRGTFAGHLRIGFVSLGVALTALSCGPKNFHEDLEYSKSDQHGAENEAQITNPISNYSGSYVMNNTVAIVQNYNPKTRQYFGICSGVRLSSTIVLTAAHCISKFENMRIIIGSHINTAITDDRKVIEIQDVKIHESYLSVLPQSEKRFFDLALIRTKRSLFAVPNSHQITKQFAVPQTPESAFQQNTHELNPYSTNASVISGYGVYFTKPENGSPTTVGTMHIGQLNEAPVELLTYDLLDPIINLKSGSLSQACLGDSGGPLFVFTGKNYYLQGIAISIKEGTKTDHFSTSLCEKQSSYLNLDFFKGWIVKNLEKLNNPF